MTDGATFKPDPSWPSMLELAIKLWGEVTDRTNPRDLRFGTRQSKAIDPVANTWFDWEAKEGGGYLDFHLKAMGVSPDKPKPNGHDKRDGPWNHIGKIYPYNAADGTLVFDVIRTLPTWGKRFSQRRPDPTTRSGWRWNLKGIKDADKPLYRLPELLASGNAPVLIPEGEKDCDNLRDLGFTATCNSGGAGKWHDEYAEMLRGRDCVVLPDFDPQSTDKNGNLLWHPNGRPKLTGQDHAAAVACSLLGIAASVRVLTLPGLPPKGDATDWLQAGGTALELRRLAREQPEYVPGQRIPFSGELEGVGRLRQRDNNGGAGAPPPPGGDPPPGPSPEPEPEPEPPDDDIPPGDDDVDPVVLPDLFVLKADLPLVSRALRDRLAAHPWMFERGAPVRLVTYPPEENRLAEVPPFGVDGVVHVAHEVCRPYEINWRGKRSNITLPNRVAALYLALNGRWNLRPLHGICGSVLLDDDGGIHAHEGYHEPSGLWCSRAPPLTVPERPFKDQAVDALNRLRAAMRTFTFKGAPLVAHDGNLVVDITLKAGLCESSALCGLLTAVCRASLTLAPGIMINAPAFSGSGVGKGLLARMISAIAFGVAPKASTAGHDEMELEKRIGAVLMRGDPVLLLDNLNNTLLRSPQLESCLTEQEISVRVFGKLEMQDIRTIALVILTGNGLQASGDAARRYVYPTLEPPVDNPAQRAYAPGFLDGIFARRAELLSDCLTIWRWGRQQSNLKRGLPLGSYERWAEWVRDPLLALGCADPVDAIAEVRNRDPARVSLIALFEAWSAHHGGWVKADELDWRVRHLVDDKERPAAIRKRLNELVGSRVGGYLLRGKEEGKGKHKVWYYCVTPDE